MKIESEYASWQRARRVLWLVLAALSLQLLAGPAVRLVLLPLFGIDISLFPGTTQASVHLLEGVAATIVALGTVRLVPMAESRRSARFLGLATLITVLGAAQAIAAGLSHLGLHAGGLVFQLPAALQLAPWGETSLHTAELIALVLGLSDVGFVTRSWVVLGAPTILAALLGQIAFSLLGCGSPTALQALCGPHTLRLRAFPQLLHWLSAISIVFAGTLLLVSLVERARSVWRVVLAPEAIEAARQMPSRTFTADAAEEWYDQHVGGSWSW